MKMMINFVTLATLVERALAEDIPYIDITSDLLIPPEKEGKAIMTAKENGVISGIAVAEMVFNTVDKHLEIKKQKKDGETVSPGDHILEISGKLISILKAERTALNFLQRMSGISTQAKKISELVKDTHAKIVDTRKTTPGMRMLEKYAVLMGGCFNHRFNLSDAVMIKDNHIKAVGSITEAIKKAKQITPHTSRIEVEVTSLHQFLEATQAGADIIMLDNMNVRTMKEIVRLNKSKRILEASGNMNETNIAAVAKTGIDIISVGSLTHSVKSLDISLNIQ